MFYFGWTEQTTYISSKQFRYVPLATDFTVFCLMFLDLVVAFFVWLFVVYRSILRGVCPKDVIKI
jgi:hypothetical protein